MWLHSVACTPCPWPDFAAVIIIVWYIFSSRFPLKPDRIQKHKLVIGISVLYIIKRASIYNILPSAWPAVASGRARARYEWLTGAVSSVAVVVQTRARRKTEIGGLAEHSSKSQPHACVRAVNIILLLYGYHRRSALASGTSQGDDRNRSGAISKISGSSLSVYNNNNNSNNM